MMFAYENLEADNQETRIQHLGSSEEFEFNTLSFTAME